ncbi:U1 small nuclear ribonucleoprotein 70 kDa [Rhizophagus clarus]|uniref:U1 small nuclear ribonucleoprotein 70 kDa n=1 Tax=Rhizophagus clarus TaxID=94130 RepID=A0A8H3M594_9GLOM|nr:U1 small nuclear ribonucleoprotein 70 kDa [Rhizophagus clarus]
MTDKLPHNLLALFAPRPPLPYAKPLDRDPVKRKGPSVTGVGQYVPLLKDYDPDYVPTETVEEKKKRKLAEKKKKAEEAIKKGLEEWDPNKDENVTGDPFKTLFVARMSYDITEKDLRREFEMYGPVENIRIVKRKDDGKPRGYAFIEFEREKDMKAAYKDADGVKLLGRRILVDVERGRTVKGWRPRRLGGGLGGTRIGGPEQNQKYSGREVILGEQAGGTDIVVVVMGLDMVVGMVVVMEVATIVIEIIDDVVVAVVQEVLGDTEMIDMGRKGKSF